MPDGPVVSNTSPLLYLHQIGQLDLLRRLYGQVVVPEGVVNELARGTQLGIDVPDIKRHPWLREEAPPERRLLQAFVDLGQGEAEAIALGLAHAGSLLLLDDGLARRTAAVLELRFTGTIGLLVKAKQAGVLDSVLPSLQALRKSTFRVTDELIHWALREAGEE